jgi:hypothetical protein
LLAYFQAVSVYFQSLLDKVCNEYILDLLCRAVIYIYIRGCNVELKMTEILSKGEIFGARSNYRAQSGYIAFGKYLQISVVAKPIFAFT